ncbi:MAG: RNA polymerase subunit sigma-24 [Bacteroidetes bacterium GWC2_33_15]|nr:MAG: RNA polymerase subunit sigma-24 [Bacteroidetes bacterium GWA2_33_15]OFX49143.1 MAG: RNA polymerase subunit sigma-24 [Bacteroidetes bacterium GWC2_33_15]OFX64911.1 MAG: RNA polymerase subunit sigma-24 [Bacteroidetes bacterium GWB2_32_14]OFX68619.1 MAG: RNA polymerase subunit sigma-24 [Bacteroidetes bacterium GWD2_33_33]HAN17470.1 RNA polymerase subunit sigma-24 [Bacteroidales bacterium]
MEINPNLSEKGKHDYKLVLLALKGDEKAYAELLDRYKDAIYYMLLKMVNNKSDADDLTIEAFGKAFKNIEQYTPNYAFSTWLFKIATNNCIDFIRKKKASLISLDQTSDELEGISTPLQSDSPDPEEDMIKNQRIALMRNVVEKLKPRYRTLVDLRYFKEYSYEEIANELNLPIGTVKAQLFRARELLYNILKNSNPNIK